MCFAMSILFSAITGCGSVADSSAEASPVGDPPEGSAQSSVICPYICGTGTQCLYPDGSCREACNDCLCEAQGGKVVESCGQVSSSDPASDPAAESSAADSSIPAELDEGAANKLACGNTFCKKGEFCCNPSCSICAPNGGFCTQQFCG